VAWEPLEAAVAPYRKRVLGYVLPKTLTYLHRSGRIGGIARFVGGLLRILPVLLVRDGQVEAGPRVRGFMEGMHKMAELFRKDFPEGALVHLAPSGFPAWARALGEFLGAEEVQILSTLQAGAAVIVHTGPGTIAFFAGPRR
jgi:Uncharacterized protein conserved in bacteria, COG1307